MRAMMTGFVTAPYDHLGKHAPELDPFVGEVVSYMPRSGRVGKKSKSVGQGGQHIVSRTFSILFDQVSFDLSQSW
jgi:hypothetical protein